MAWHGCPGPVPSLKRPKPKLQSSGQRCPDAKIVKIGILDYILNLACDLQVSKEPFDANLDVPLIQEASESNRQSALVLGLVAAPMRQNQL